MPHFPELTGRKKADVLVIGGGMSGLLCARLLRDAGASCILLEAKEICSGVTKDTTAKITALHGLRCRNMIRRWGIERARQYYHANLMAIERYARMSSGIDCGFSRQDAFVYTTVGAVAIEQEAEALRQIGINADLVSCPQLPFRATAVRLTNQAQFDPLRFASVIAEGMNIFEHSPVISVNGLTAFTPSGSVEAKKIIIATHFPFINRRGSYFLKLYQERSYVIALENAPRMEGMYLEDTPDGLSVRMHGELLLMGGQNHRTGQPTGGWGFLEQAAARLFPEARIKYRWATQDCMTLDGIPYIGNYSALTPDWYVATGFNKWGMTSSMVAAELLTELVQGRERTCTSVFSPSRSMLTSQLASNIGHSVKEIVTLRKPRCPHMGCALKWNAAERTWDCPCHGSRFDEKGGIIDNPTTKPCHPDK